MNGDGLDKKVPKPRAEELPQLDPREDHAQLLTVMMQLEEAVRTSKLRGGIQIALINDLQTLRLLHMDNLGQLDPKPKLRPPE